MNRLNIRKIKRVRAHSWGVVAFCALCLGTSELEGQLPPEVSEGSRVRVEAPGYLTQVTIGTVLKQTDASLTLSLDDEEAVVTVPHERITSLDVSVGRRPQGMKYALRGVIIGGLGGAGIGYLMGDDSSPPCTPESSSHPLGDLAASLGCGLRIEYSARDKATVLAVLLGSVGGVVGFLGGRTYMTDDWSPVLERNGAVHITVEPSKGSASADLGFRIVF